MSSLKDYEIKFSGLKLGKHQFDFELDNTFFELFDYSEFEACDIKANLIMQKKENALELDFVIRGTATVLCDLTVEPFDMPLENNLQLLVKYGESYDDTNETVLILPWSEHSVNISQYLYELTALALPLKRVHPDVVSGKKGSEILKKLEELSPEVEREQEENKSTDPRWDQLKSFLN